MAGSGALTLVVAFVAGGVLAGLTAPVGVSGAVFLLPMQLDVLRVPSPAVTPTNLLFNLVATPGALWRYWRVGVVDVRLTGRLLVGTVPGVVIGSVVGVYAAPGDRVFRLLAAAVLHRGQLPTSPAERRKRPPRRTHDKEPEAAQQRPPLTCGRALSSPG